MENKLFLKWWLIFTIQAFVMTFAGWFGFFYLMYEADHTRISFLILSLWFFYSLKIGYDLYSSSATNLKVGEFVATSCQGMGLIGTVGGFIIMLSAGLDTSNAESISNSLGMMLAGTGIAMYATITGIVMSLFIDWQLTLIKEKK